jgi:hypothetical protein
MAEVTAAAAKFRLVEIAEEVMNILATDPNGTIRVPIEIAAHLPYGASDAIKRAVSENASRLGFKTRSCAWGSDAFYPRRPARAGIVCTTFSQSGASADRASRHSPPVDRP